MPNCRTPNLRMSGRRKSSLGSKRTRRARLTVDDSPQSLQIFLSCETSYSTRRMLPRKITARRTAARSPLQSTSSEVITIDDTPESASIESNVNARVDSFMQTGSFVSSDEDETEMIKTKSNKKVSRSHLFVSDDSDDDCKVIEHSSTTLNSDVCKPGTSAEVSSDSSKNNTSKCVADDVMDFVDSILDSSCFNKDENTQNPLRDMESLEDYRKETEKMLKNASSLLEEIKTGKKFESEPKDVVTIKACPICMESLANRSVYITVCGHIFCKDCIVHVAKTLKKCPTCRSGINMKKIHPVYF